MGEIAKGKQEQPYNLQKLFKTRDDYRKYRRGDEEKRGWW